MHALNWSAGIRCATESILALTPKEKNGLKYFRSKKYERFFILTNVSFFLNTNIIETLTETALKLMQTDYPSTGHQTFFMSKSAVLMHQRAHACS